MSSPLLVTEVNAGSVQKLQKKKLITFENKCLRKIMNIRWYEFKTNREIREMSKQPYITTIIRSRRRGYYGHALRMNDTKIPKQMTKWNTTGNVEGADQKKPYVEHQ